MIATEGFFCKIHAGLFLLHSQRLHASRQSKHRLLPGFSPIFGGIFVGNFFLSECYYSLPLLSFILAKHILTFQIIAK
jgi:hypothetical protein